MKIPDYIKNINKELKNANFSSYIVGGCLRDLLLERTPKDWDITTNALPEQILKIFPNGKYDNIFGTVLLPIKDKDEKVLDLVEITTYRSEQGYSDRRHPDEIKFETKLDRDLERRDFTINALAADIDNQINPDIPKKYQESMDNLVLVDLFGGAKDLNKKIIRSVGEPSERFREDALRMLRAIRFSCELDFSIEPKTLRAITKLAGSIKFISFERIRDEFIKIISSNRAYEGIELLRETKLLQYILPELVNCIGVKQNKHHTYTVYKHLVMSLKNCPNPNWQIRLACLFHDIGKPKVKKITKVEATFYNHEYAGANMVARICKRLKFSNKDREKITNLVRNHMFYYNVDEVTASSVRKLIKKVGPENLKDLIDVRIGDRMGSGVAKAKPYKLRHLEYMFERVQNDPISVKQLKLNGNDLMTELKLKPSPKIGAILDTLLSQVIEDPKLNTKKHLLSEAKKLINLNLEELRQKAKQAIEEKRKKDDKKMKKGYYVK